MTVKRGIVMFKSDYCLGVTVLRKWDGSQDRQTDRKKDKLYVCLDMSHSVPPVNNIRNY